MTTFADKLMSLWFPQSHAMCFSTLLMTLPIAALPSQFAVIIELITIGLLFAYTLSAV